ncbi:unnamed protein product, partial [Prorocentrum cordatum]
GFLTVKLSKVLFARGGVLDTFGSAAAKVEASVSNDMAEALILTADSLQGAVPAKEVQEYSSLAVTKFLSHRVPLAKTVKLAIQDSDGDTVEYNVSCVALLWAPFFADAQKSLATFNEFASKIVPVEGLTSENRESAVTSIADLLTECKKVSDSRRTVDNFKKQVDEAKAAGAEMQQMQGVDTVYFAIDVMCDRATNALSEAANQLFNKMKATVSELLEKIGDLEKYLARLDDSSTTVAKSDREELYKFVCTQDTRALYQEFRWVSDNTAELRKMLAEFNNGEPMINFETDEVFQRAGKLAASSTMMQSFWRPLKPEESRTTLVRRCVRALNPDVRGVLMKPHACVQQACSNLSAVTDDADDKPAEDRPAEQVEPAAEEVVVVDAEAATRRRSSQGSQGGGAPKRPKARK